MYLCPLEQPQQPRAASHLTHDAMKDQQGRTTRATLQYRPVNLGVQQSQSAHLTSHNAGHHQEKMSNWQSPAGSFQSGSFYQIVVGTSNNDILRTLNPQNANVNLLIYNTGTTSGPYKQTVLGNAAYNGQMAQNHMSNQNIGQQQTFPSTCAPNIYQAGSQSFTDNSNAVHSSNGQSLTFSNTSHKTQEYSAQPSNYEGPAPTNSSSSHSPNQQYNSHNFQANFHYRSPTVPVFTGNVQKGPSYSDALKWHMINGGMSGPSLGLAPTSGSSCGLSPSYSGSHHTVTQERTSLPAPNSQLVSHVASEGNILQAKQPHPRLSAQSSYTISNQFQKAPPWQSAGSTVPCSTFQQSPATAEIPANHHKIPTTEEEKLKLASQWHMINSRMSGPSSGTAPTSGSSCGLSPSYSGSHHTVTQERTSLPAPNSQLVSHVASEGNILQAKQPHPRLSAQSSYTISNQFQKAPPWQSAGSTVPCSTVQQSPATAVIPANHHKIPTTEEKKLKLASQWHMINGGMSGPSSGMAPTSGSSCGLSPSYSGSHYTVTQERTALPVPNSQLVSHVASEGNILQAKQPHPRLSAQSSYTISNQFQKALPRQSVGSTVPCSTVQQSPATAVIPANHHKIPTTEEEKLKIVSLCIDKRISQLVRRLNSVETKSSETPQVTDSSSLSNMVEQNDGSVGAPPAGLGNKAVAVVQPLPLGCLQQMTHRTTTSERMIISENGANSLRIEKPPSSCPNIPPSPCPDKPPEKKSCESMSSHAGGIEAGSLLSATDSGHQNSTRKPEQVSQSEPAAQKPETPETQRNQNSPEVQGEKETSCAASPGLSISSSPVRTSGTAKETPEGSSNLYFLKEDEAYTEPAYKSSWLNVNEQLDDIDKEFGFPLSLKYHCCSTESDEESQDAETSSPAPVSETSDQASQQTQTIPEDRDETRDLSSQILSLSDSENESFGFKLEVLSPTRARCIFEQINTESSVVMIDDEAPSSPIKSKIAPSSPSNDEESREVYCIQPIFPLKSSSEPIVVVDDDQSDPIIISDSENEDVSNGRDETSEEMENPDIIQLNPEEVGEASLQPSTLNCGDKLTEDEEKVETSDHKEDCEQAQLKSSDSTEFPSKTEGVRAPLNDTDKSEKRKRPSSDLSSQFTQEVKKCKQSDLRSQEVVSEREKSSDPADPQSSSPKDGKVVLVLFGSLNTSESDSPGSKKHNRSICMSERKPPKILSVNHSPPKKKPKELEQMGKCPDKQLLHEQCRESFQPTKTHHHKKMISLSMENLKKHNKDILSKVSKLGPKNKSGPRRKLKEPEYMGKSSVKKWLHEHCRESFLPTKTHHHKKMTSLSMEKVKKHNKDISSKVSKLGPKNKYGPRRKPNQPEYIGKSSVKQWLHEQWRESFLPTRTHHRKKITSLSMENPKKHIEEISSTVSELGPKNIRGQSLAATIRQFNEQELEREKCKNDVVPVMKPADTQKNRAQESQRDAVRPNLVVKFNFENKSKRRTDTPDHHSDSLPRIHEKPPGPHSIVKKSSISCEVQKKLEKEIPVHR